MAPSRDKNGKPYRGYSSPGMYSSGINIRMEPEMVGRVVTYASKFNITRAEAIRTLIENGLEENEVAL